MLCCTWIITITLISCFVSIGHHQPLPTLPTELRLHRHHSPAVWTLSYLRTRTSTYTCTCRYRLGRIHLLPAGNPASAITSNTQTAIPILRIPHHLSHCKQIQSRLWFNRSLCRVNKQYISFNQKYFFFIYLIVLHQLFLFKILKLIY